jgi:hypothetical protein
MEFVVRIDVRLAGRVVRIRPPGTSMAMPVPTSLLALGNIMSPRKAALAYLFNGRSGTLLRTYTCRIPGDTFGFDAAGMGG